MHHGWYGQKSGESVIDMRKGEKAVAQIYTGRGEEKTICVSPERTLWSLLLFALLKEASKTSRLLGDRNESKVVDRTIRVGRLGQWRTESSGSGVP
jgi:hypothetical protein